MIMVHDRITNNNAMLLERDSNVPKSGMFLLVWLAIKTPLEAGGGSFPSPFDRRDKLGLMCTYEFPGIDVSY